MALAQKKNTKQNTTLMIILVVVVIGAVVAYTFLRPSTVSPDASSSQSLSRDPEIFTDFGQDLYNLPQYKALHDFYKSGTPTELTPTPVPVPNPTIDDQVDLPPNTEIGNPNPFST